MNNVAAIAMTPATHTHIEGVIGLRPVRRMRSSRMTPNNHPSTEPIWFVGGLYLVGSVLGW
ncbi:MAG: hypothetical protein AAGJ55_07640, partial [Cyanobacteria bacterium J06555_12]